MKSALVFAYIGFGLGMMLGIIRTYDKFTYKDKEMGQIQIAIFIVGMGLFWPLRFYKPLSKHVLMKEKGMDVWHHF